MLDDLILLTVDEISGKSSPGLNYRSSELASSSGFSIAENTKP